MLQRQRDPRLNEILFPFFDLKRTKQIIDTHEPNDEARMQGCKILFHCKNLVYEIETEIALMCMNVTATMLYYRAPRNADAVWR